MPARTLVLPLAGVAAVALIAASCGEDSRAEPAGATTLEPNAVVAGIVDGDTIDVVVAGRDERVRLIGIDTPETKRPDTPIECFGPEASAFTSSLLTPGTAVRLERDVVGRDDYGRLLAYVYRASDGLFVNHELVREGYAVTLTYPPNVAHADAFVAAARRAEQADLGLWSRC